VIRTALALAVRGLHVFPCRPRTKLPATPHGFKDATVDPDLIRQWWGIEPTFNVAIATGKVSGVFAIDVDSLDAEGALRRLEKAHGELPPTVEAVTSRGRHAYFLYPANKAVSCSADDRIAAGVHVRGDYGYTIAPPSVHPCGRAYHWSVDSARTVAAAPAWLLDRIVEPIQAKPVAADPGIWVRLVADGVDEGQRDNSATRLAGYLLRHRLDAGVVLEMLRLWNATRCRPPLDGSDIDRIVNSISRAEHKRRHGRD